MTIGHLPGCACCAPRLGRRVAARTAFAASAAMAAAGGALRPAAAFAQAGRPATPQAAIDALMAGNGRFVSKQSGMAACTVDLSALKQATASGQAPFAAVLGCADSRVPPELAFDVTIGDLFVCRVAGNIASADIIGSLEYGAAVLGTKAILVMGHSSCGAVHATIEGKAVPGQISTLYRSIRPAVALGGHDEAAVVKANARIQAALLRDSSPVLADMVKQGKLSVLAAYYELATGQVTLLD